MGSFHIPTSPELSYIHIPRTGLGIKTLIDSWIIPNCPSFYVDNWMINHPNLRMLREQIPTGKTFSVIRNPWMRVWSFYRKIFYENYWQDWNGFKSSNLKPFNEWLQDYSDPAYDFDFPRWFTRWTQMQDFVEYKDLNGNLYTIDFLLRAESLEIDIEHIKDYLKIPGKLPDISKYKENKNYRYHFTEVGAECVYKVHERDIIKYGYEF